MEEFEIIVGVHSIHAALLNPKRTNKVLYCTEEGRDKFLKVHPLSKEMKDELEWKYFNSHDLQITGEKLFKELEFEFSRISSQIFLTCSPLQDHAPKWLYDEAITRDKFHILCLDQISDVHNGGAIFRTASFYNIDAIVAPGRNSFRLTPSFYKIASGAAEYVPLVRVSNLSKLVRKLSDMGIDTIALTEHEEENFKPSGESKSCLILGKENSGISHAVLRVASKKMALSPLGKTLSLNVSIAGAVAMEKCFGISTE